MQFFLKRCCCLFQCFFYGFLVSNIYKSSLVAHLTSPSYSKTVSFEEKHSSRGLNERNQVDTLEELVASGDFSWGIVNYGAADYQLFSTSEVIFSAGSTLVCPLWTKKVPLYKQIFEGLEFCPDPVACMTRASKGGFAYISWKVADLDLIQ